MLVSTILMTINFLCIQLEARMGNSSYDNKGHYRNFNFPDHNTRNTELSRNPYENQWTYNTQRNRTQMGPQNQTMYMSEGHQPDPYKTQINNDRTIQTQYSSRSGAWGGHTDRNNPQGPNPHPNWNPDQKPNWDTGRQSNQFQSQDSYPRTQNLDKGRQDYYQALNSRPQNQNWGPVNRNQYNPQQNIQSFSPQPVINPVSVGIVPFIDPDLPDGLDDLWELQQKQAAVQHMLQTNPGLGTHAMVPGTISSGQPSHQFGGVNNVKDTGGPGHVKVWTNPRTQNTSINPWDQQYVPHRSNMETENIRREKINKEGSKMSFHPSSFADVSNKFVENKMSVEEKKDLLGTSDTYQSNSGPRQLKLSVSATGTHPLVQTVPVPDTKTTYLATEETGQTYRRRRYRKRGQNKNYRKIETTTHDVRTSTTAPSVVWNVSHGPSKSQYETDLRHRYRSMINKQRTTTSSPHEQDYYYGNRDGYYQQRYDKRPTYHTTETKHNKGPQTAPDKRPTYHTTETKHNKGPQAVPDRQMTYNIEQKWNNKRLAYQPEKTWHEKPMEIHDKQNLWNSSPSHSQSTKSDMKSPGTYEKYSPWDVSPDRQKQKHQSTKSSFNLDPRQIPTLAEFSDHGNMKHRDQKSSHFNENVESPAMGQNVRNDNRREKDSHRTRTEHQYQYPQYRNTESKHYLQYQQRNLSPRSRDVEREQETETENENGRTSYSYSTEYRSHPENPKINREMLNQMIAERIRQRQMSRDRNNTMPWSPVSERGSRPHPNKKLNDKVPIYTPRSQRENYMRGNTRISTKDIQHFDRNRHFLQESVDPRTARQPLPPKSGDHSNSKMIHNINVNKTEIPAISGREVWTDPANQKEIEAGKPSQTILDEIIDNFLLGGGDEIETPFGKIESEGNGGYEIDGPLLKLILSEIANKPKRHNLRSPEQLEHLRKFSGFDTSKGITPSPVNNDSSTPISSTPSTVLQESTTIEKKVVDEKRQRIIWDSLPIFENPRTEHKDKVPEEPSTSGRQIWNHMKPWDTVWKPKLGQKKQTSNTGTPLSEPWEPVKTENSYNPIFESKIHSNMKTSSHQVKETRLVGEKSEMSKNNVKTTVSMVTKQTTATPNTKSTANIDIPVQSTKSPEANIDIPVQSTTSPEANIDIPVQSTTSAELWSQILFDEPYNLKKTPPVAARMIMIPEENVKNRTKTENKVERNTIKPVEQSDSAFGIIFAIVAVIVVLVAPVICIVWRIRKHFKEKNRKQLKTDNFDNDEFEMETMISNDFGHCDDREKYQGARPKTQFNKYSYNIQELQLLKSGRISPNVIVHQEDEIY